jgi:hypothetical protein
MLQELKTIAIVVSATLAALFVHHALEQPQASAGEIGLQETVSVIMESFEPPTFE